MNFHYFTYEDAVLLWWAREREREWTFADWMLLTWFSRRIFADENTPIVDLIFQCHPHSSLISWLFVPKSFFHSAIPILPLWYPSILTKGQKREWRRQTPHGVRSVLKALAKISSEHSSKKFPSTFLTVCAIFYDSITSVLVNYLLFVIWKVRIHEINCSYNINSVPLTKVSSHKHLGVSPSSDLSWKSHVLSVAAKANRILGLLKRTFGRCFEGIKMGYISMFRPMIEYACPVWNLH